MTRKTRTTDDVTKESDARSVTTDDITKESDARSSAENESSETMHDEPKCQFFNLADDDQENPAQRVLAERRHIVCADRGVLPRSRPDASGEQNDGAGAD